MTQQFKNILLVNTGSFQDVLFSVSLLNSLQSTFPGSKLTCIVNRQFLPLLEKNRDITHLLSCSDDQSLTKLITVAESQSFDLCIDLTGSFRSAWLCKKVGGGATIGLAGLFKRFFYSHTISEAEKLELLVAPTMLSPAIRFKQLDYQPMLEVMDEERTWAELYLQSGGVTADAPIAGISPGGLQNNRLWPTLNYIYLANRLIDEGWKVVLFQEAEQGAFMQRIMDRVDKDIVSLPVQPLRKSAALLSHMDLLIGNYSDLLFLAAAVRTKVIPLIGPDNPETVNKKLSAFAQKTVYAAVDCRNQCTTECPFGSLECLKRVQLEDVMQAAYEFYPDMTS